MMSSIYKRVEQGGRRKSRKRIMAPSVKKETVGKTVLKRQKHFIDLINKL